jgi:hypothetical protein
LALFPSRKASIFSASDLENVFEYRWDEAVESILSATTEEDGASIFAAAVLSTTTMAAMDGAGERG